MLELSEKIKSEILTVLLTENNLFVSGNGNNIIEILDEVLALKSLPSLDPRYDNAYDDAIQHLINNDDWNYEYTLTERFDILTSTSIFISFLQKIINPVFRNDEDDIMKYYLLINPYLEKEDLQFIIIEYDQFGSPIYEIVKFEEGTKIPVGLKLNNIPFFIDASSSKFPSFYLTLNTGWNDFGIVSSYELHYKESKIKSEFIGYLRIIHKENSKTAEEIPKTFKILNATFCSLGIDLDYYENLKRIFGRSFESILWSLQDSAFFNDIHENYENNYNFKKSLIRYNEQERLVREAKYQIYDYNLKNLYSFKYTFKPKFTDDEIEVDFNFDKKGIIPNRIFAIIGKNGTGKTQLVTSLPVDIWKKKNENFTPKTPLFSKVIAVSYSAFDNFEIPKKTSDFNYVYCGLKNEKGEQYSSQGLKVRFHSSWKKIEKRDHLEKWVKILGNFISQDLINEFIIEKYGTFSVDIKGFNTLSKKLSSGQSILLYIITEIIANIRLDSLLIYDEPETHLHPNAISQLVNTIYELVTEFESYCIIATHSPLIIRELMSKSVYIIERENDFASIRKPNIETFGENLTILTEEVFGNKEISKQFKKILNDLIEDGKSYDDIISVIENDGVPLSLNVRIYLKSIINDKS